ncbi:MAG: TetR/AcrR family transcriptional regulator [Anaerolineaceae bacterium]
MTTEELEAKQRIFDAVTVLLQEEVVTEKITMRRIAERAGVGIGLINYHFQSREKLLNEVVNQTMTIATESWFDPTRTDEIPALQRLRNILIETAQISAKYPQFAEISVTYDLLHGDFGIEKMILPILREHFGPLKTELEITTCALMLISCLQVILLRRIEFKTYSGINIFDDKQRDFLIDLMLNLIMNK